MAALVAAIDQALTGSTRRVVIDLSQVDYISSAGVEALRASGRRLGANGAALILCSPSDPVRITLNLAGNGGEFSLEPSRDTALT